MRSRPSTYAFADCTNLERINGATEFDAVKTTFPKATFGVTPFYNTKIEGSAGSSGFETEMQGRQELNVGGARTHPHSTFPCVRPAIP